MPVLLTAHNLPCLGTKDQLVLRVLMLRHGHADEAALKEYSKLSTLQHTATDKGNTVHLLLRLLFYESYRSKYDCILVLQL
jgi:hypothetical protein